MATSTTIKKSNEEIWTDDDNSALLDLIATPSDPSIFNRDVYCSSPRGIDPVSGQVLFRDSHGRPSRCRKRSCEYCSKTEAIGISYAIMRSHPTHDLCVTDVGPTYQEKQVKVSKLVKRLRKHNRTVKLLIVCEVGLGSRSNRHGHCKLHFSGQLTKAQVEDAVSYAGLGPEFEYKAIPDHRRNVVAHSAYLFKSLDAPLIRDQFLDLNRTRSAQKLEYHTRGFFRAGSDRPT